MSLWIKICGVTSVEDALMIEKAGADALGLNFAGASPRCIDRSLARTITEAVKDRIEVVGVFVDSTLEEVHEIALMAGLDTVQLHGTESAEFLAAMNQKIPAYKALRVGGPEDVVAAEVYSGDRILTDAKVAGAMGGTGETFDWNLIADLNESRKLILAGGLKPDNVEACVRAVLPYGIDTASGVELSPGVKDPAKVEAFIAAARRGYGH